MRIGGRQKSDRGLPTVLIMHDDESGARRVAQVGSKVVKQEVIVWVLGKSEEADRSGQELPRGQTQKKQRDPGGKGNHHYRRKRGDSGQGVSEVEEGALRASGHINIKDEYWAEKQIHTARITRRGAYINGERGDTLAPLGQAHSSVEQALATFRLERLCTQRDASPKRGVRRHSLHCVFGVHRPLVREAPRSQHDPQL